MKFLLEGTGELLYTTSPSSFKVTVLIALKHGCFYSNVTFEIVEFNTINSIEAISITTDFLYMNIYNRFSNKNISVNL